MADEPAATSTIPGLAADWPQTTTARIVDLVDQTKLKTSGPAIKISRAVVYGLVAALVGMVAVPVLLIGLTRSLVALFDLWVAHDKAVWISYFALGGVMILGGLFFWRKRPKGAAVPTHAA
jgi:hypothetical protein